MQTVQPLARRHNCSTVDCASIASTRSHCDRVMDLKAKVRDRRRAKAKAKAKAKATRKPESILFLQAFFAHGCRLHFSVVDECCVVDGGPHLLQLSLIHI